MDNLSTAGAVSASGMTAQRRRLEVLISNLVNSNATQIAGKEPYGRKDVVFSAEPLKSEGFKKTFDVALAEAHGVSISKMVTDDAEPIKRYEPSHPHADKEGYVLYQNINPMEGMANILSATRSYEASLEARKSTRGMKDKALEIPR